MFACRSAMTPATARWQRKRAAAGPPCAVAGKTQALAFHGARTTGLRHLRLLLKFATHQQSRAWVIVLGAHHMPRSCHGSRATLSFLMVPGLLP
jgi:hypothetical protein